MIVDIHTHFFRPDSAFGTQLKDDMQRCGVDPTSWQFDSDQYWAGVAQADVAVVFGLQAAATGWFGDNTAVYEHYLTAPDRLVFFACIDPQQEGYMEELERCYDDLGCQGVKLGPVYQGVHPLDARYYEIYRYCERRRLPIIVHMATTFSSGVPLEYARPIHMDQVSVDFPELKIILAHLGHPWEPETIAIIRKQPNVYADLSALYYRPWQFYNAMRLVVEYRASGKVFLGSDFPATTTANAIDGLRRVNEVAISGSLPPVPAEIIESIIHRDALSMLGLEHPGIQSLTSKR